jgi:hypothetical protein
VRRLGIARGCTRGRYCRLRTLYSTRAVYTWTARVAVCTRMSFYYDVARSETPSYPLEPVRRRKYVGPVQNKIVILNSLRRSVRGWNGVHYLDVSHGQEALHQWAKEILQATSEYNGSYYTLSIAERCPEVRTEADACEWLMAQAIPPYLATHLKSGRIKVTANVDEALVACFVDAKSDDEWRQTQQDAIEEEENKRRHDAMRHEQWSWERPHRPPPLEIPPYTPDPMFQEHWKRHAAARSSGGTRGR